MPADETTSLASIHTMKAHTMMPHWPESYKEGGVVRRRVVVVVVVGAAGERVVLGAAGERVLARSWRESLLETRVRTSSDASQRDVHVQARAPCPTPEGLEGRSPSGRREKGKSQLPFSFHLGLCK